MSELNMKIDGMSCGSCSKAITTRLSKFDFTSDINIDHKEGIGKLILNDPFEENKQKVIKAIIQIGYKVIE